jgi:hypothetical protein
LNQGLFRVELIHGSIIGHAQADQQRRMVLVTEQMG